MSRLQGIAAAVRVPAFAGTEYGRTSLRHLLQMSSGVRFVEGYATRGSDADRLAAATYRQVGAEGVDAVTPASRLVMVQTAVRSESRDQDDRKEVALWRSLVREL